MDQEKRRQRELKRAIKKAGNRKLRRTLARDLQVNPEGAANAEVDHGRDSSAPLNGIDHDSTRRSSRRPPPEEDVEP